MGQRETEAAVRPPQLPWRTASILAMVLALVIGLVAAFGGFKVRSDSHIEGEVGATYALNAADVTILRATASLYAGTWQVSVYATVRNTADRPLRAYDLDKATGFYYTDASGTLVYYDAAETDPSVYLVSDDDPTISLPRQLIPPGSRAMPVRFRFSVKGTLISGDEYSPDAIWAENLSPQDGLRVRLTPVYYRSNTILGISNDKNWVVDTSRADYHSWIISVPIEIETG